MSVSSVVFGIQLTGQFFDPEYDPNTMPAEANSDDTKEQHVYYYMTGNTDGKLGYPSRELLIPEDYQLDYRYGYTEGLHFYKFTHFF